jgi:predicted  nucleic acid-binding Zn-ribbon protein
MSDFLTFVEGAFVNKVLSVANQWTQVGQINGTGNFANISLNFTNISPTESDTISIAISSNGTSPNNDDIIESNIPMPVGGVLSRENVIANVGEYVYILATTNNIACRLAGITQALQSIETIDAEILTLSSDVEYLSGAIDADVSNLQNEINSLSAQLASDNNNLQSEINSLSAQLASDNNNLQSEINSLSAQLASDNNNLQNQINSLSSQLSNDNSNLQNEINSLSSQLANDNNNLQNEINSLNSTVNANMLSGLFSTINNVTGSRGFGATYYNTTGKPMFVSAWGQVGGSPQGYGLYGYVNGIQVVMNQMGICGTDGNFGCGGCYPGISFIVPAGASYQINQGALNGVAGWIEMY